MPDPQALDLGLTRWPAMTTGSPHLRYRVRRG